MSKPHFICGKANMCLVTENEDKSFLDQQHFKLSPPSPPTYTIIIPPSSTSLLSSTTPSTFQPQTLLIKIVSPYFPQTLNAILPPHISITSYLIQYSISSELIAVHIMNYSNSNPQSNTTFIFSHDEQSDIGTILPSLVDLSIQFKANIIAYDYCNYGRSSSHNNNKHTFTEDSTAIIDFAVKHLKIQLNKIILIGCGIGAIPSCTLAISKNVKGIILISPIFSTFLTSKTFKKIYCPVFITHCKLNGRFSWEGLSEFVKDFPNKIEWYPKREGDKCLFIGRRRKFILKIKDFMGRVDSLLGGGEEVRKEESVVCGNENDSTGWGVESEVSKGKGSDCEYNNNKGEIMSKDINDDVKSLTSVKLMSQVKEIDWGD